MKKALFFIFPVVFLVSCGKTLQYESADEIVAEAAESVKEITVDELYTIMAEGEEIYTLIDVRQEIEYYYGFIPGSIVVPRGSLEFRITDDEFWEGAGLYRPEKDEKIIVYCKKGSRGILAAKTLESMGFKNVVSLKGGFKAWELSYPDYTDKNLGMLGGGSDTHDMGGGC